MTHPTNKSTRLENEVFVNLASPKYEKFSKDPRVNDELGVDVWNQVVHDADMLEKDPELRARFTKAHTFKAWGLLYVVQCVLQWFQKCFH